MYLAAVTVFFCIIEGADVILCCNCSVTFVIFSPAFVSGTTGENILFVGDSAGGNIILTTSMKLGTLGLRQPDHIFSFYPATLVKMCITPSRFLSIFDTMLPLGIMLSCLQV